MTIGTIIVIILALVVLVVIIYGFTTGWGNLWGKITGFGGGSSNVQTMVQACQIACTSASNYDYCNLERNVVFGKEDTNNGDYTCKILETKNIGLPICKSVTCSGSVTSTTETADETKFNTWKAGCVSAGGEAKTAKEGTCASNTLTYNNQLYYCCK